MNLVAVDLEIASTCNAACPVCIRRRSGIIADFVQQMRTLEEVQRILGDSIKEIKHIQMCGNYGDPMTCADILPICEWFCKENPLISIRISTNGGIGKPEHYRQLGELGVEMVFGVDGASKEINQLHRVNVDYNRVLRNMTEYFSNCKAIHNEWQYILFNENKHELKNAIIQAKELGVHTFYVRHPNGFAEHPEIPVFDFMGNFSHWLSQVDETYNEILDTHWDLTGITEYDTFLKLVDSIDPRYDTLLNKPAPNDVLEDETTYTPFPIYKEFVIEEGALDTETLNAIDTQHCFSYNMHDQENLNEENNYVFISYDNYVYPCCMIGSSISMAKQRDYGGIPHINDMLNSIKDFDYNDFSVNDKSLKTVLDSGILHKAYYDKIVSGNANAFCKLTCGKCTGSQSKWAVM